MSFELVKGVKPGRSVHNLSYDKKMTGDMGLIYPIVCDEMVPGDKFQIDVAVLMKCFPLVAPIMHKVDIVIDFFFCPYRKMWDAETNEETGDTGSFEDFITGGIDNDITYAPPLWEPTDTSVNSLWDYIGFPLGVDPDGAYPLDFPRRAYNWIYNEYFRDQNLMTPVGLDNEDILRSCWRKDYFTSALPFQQRGDAASLPVVGTGSAVWDIAVPSGVLGTMHYDTVDLDPRDAGTQDTLNNNTIDFSDASTVNLSEIRLAIALQQWSETSARCGSRYVEHLAGFFGVERQDVRLDRPEYLGGSKFPTIFTEVRQQSETDTTPLGTLGGHGIAGSNERCVNYYASEHGLIMGLLRVMPTAVYQQGINKQWLRYSRYDFFYPQFEDLSEQPIWNAEIFAGNVEATNQDTFGYAPRFEEMRYKPSLVVSQMRSDAPVSFDYWHLGHDYGTLPVLNESFLLCNPSKRIFAVPSEPGLIFDIHNKIRAVRPIRIEANPGLPRV